MRHTLLADRREIQTAPPRGGRFGSGNHHPSPQGGRSTPGQRKTIGHPSGGCSQTRRFKGPFGSPPFVPTSHPEASPLGSRTRRNVRFRRRRHRVAVPTSPPRHGSNSAGSLTRTNRRDRLVPLRGIRRPGSGFHNGVAPPVPFKRLHTLACWLEAPTAVEMAGRKGRASHRHRSGLKIPARPLSATVTPLAFKWPAIPTTKSAVGGPDNAVSPHQFSPLGTPLS
jgi:hypothetical protein